MMKRSMEVKNEVENCVYENVFYSQMKIITKKLKCTVWLQLKRFNPDWKFPRRSILFNYFETTNSWQCLRLFVRAVHYIR